jgi:shikimate kinase
VKLIFIYGPTAVGKYTVGHTLAELTGYKFFHNHLTVDVVRAIFDDEDIRRDKLLDTLRLDVIKVAARDNINTIFTLAYTSDVDPLFIANIIEAVTSQGGSIHFVRLNAPDTTLFERIGNESRRPLGKPTDPEHLRLKMTKCDVRAKIDYPARIELNTSKLTPQESARRIIEAFEL